jgi:serine O-acetyltransferase
MPPNLDITFRASTLDDLIMFTATQLNNMFPHQGLVHDREELKSVYVAALYRMRPILETVRNFIPKEFNHFNSMQYATMLYLLANEHWLTHQNPIFADRLFCLNRALNSIDLFYTVTMPEIFLVAHGLGAVLGNVSYQNYFVFFQNTTVGRVGEDRPVFGENVILYPNATITGCSTIGENCVISAGSIVHNRNIPSNTLVFMQGNELIMKPAVKNYKHLYFRF